MSKFLLPENTKLEFSICAGSEIYRYTFIDPAGALIDLDINRPERIARTPNGDRFFTSCGRSHYVPRTWVKLTILHRCGDHNQAYEGGAILDGEIEREYQVPNGHGGFCTVSVKKARELKVGSDHGHQIICASGNEHIIPPKWFHLSWTVEAGSYNFSM